MNTLHRVAAAAFALMAGHSQICAWDGSLSGVISAVDSLPNSGNYDFRVYLRDQAGPWCGPGSSSWGGMHATEPNFKGVQAILTIAFVSGKTVTMYLTRDANSICKIGYVTVAA